MFINPDAVKQSYLLYLNGMNIYVCAIMCFSFLHTRVGDSRCVSKWYTTYVGDRFSEVMTQ